VPGRHPEPRGPLPGCGGERRCCCPCCCWSSSRGCRCSG
jgi:hypothetical protein